MTGTIEERGVRDETGPARVLVVEDDRPLRELLVDFVRREGYEADAAEDGVEGLFSLEWRPADVIVLDLSLPRMDGYEFMAALAERFGRGRPKVIVLTGAERLGFARARLGAEAYLAKPFDIERMRAALSRLCVPAARRAVR